jgi:hypothetical protein
MSLNSDAKSLDLANRLKMHDLICSQSTTNWIDDMPTENGGVNAASGTATSNSALLLIAWLPIYNLT